MTTLPEYVKQLLTTIAKSEGFTDYKLQVQPGSKHGDGFLGIMTSIQIIGSKQINGKATANTLHLLCKTPPTNVQRRKSFKADLVFKREIYVYNKVLPEFIKFQKEKGLSDDESFLAFPKCFVAKADEEKDEYILIMEDLRPKRFEMWPKQRPIALDHAQRIVTELGKLHGISFALKDQKPEVFKEFKSLYDLFSVLIKSDELKGFMDATLDRALTVLKKPEHLKLMKDFRQDWFCLVDDCFGKNTCEPFGVVTHGDCWNNNLLFQYGENDKNLQGMCFVDWQISRYSSPVFDLLYNLFSSTDKKLRDKHFSDLLRLYYSSLSDFIRKLGSKPENLFTYDNLTQELQRFGRFALLTGPMIIQLLLASPDDIQDMDEYSEKIGTGASMDFVKDYPDDVKKIYSETINNVISDLIEYGFVKIN